MGNDARLLLMMIVVCCMMMLLLLLQYRIEVQYCGKKAGHSIRKDDELHSLKRMIIY